MKKATITTIAVALAASSSYAAVHQIESSSELNGYDFSPGQPTAEIPRSTIGVDEAGNIFSTVQIPTNIQVDNSASLQLPQANLVGFTINVNYTGTPPPASQQAAFTAAAAAWMSRITGYRGVMTLPSVTIDAEVAPNDGVGGVLGSAGPTTVSIQDEDGVSGGNEFALTSTGSMSFDSADIDNLETGGTLGAVIEHEMGHVLGIGTLWNTAAFGGGFAGTQALYTAGSGQFTGAEAVAQWQSEFGQADAFVPVELGGGAGTADGHWNEVDGGGGLTGITQSGTGNDMRNELMTGWLNDPSFVSQMTLSSLNDIGYMTTPIPEPSAAVLGLFGLLIGFRRRR